MLVKVVCRSWAVGLCAVLIAPAIAVAQRAPTPWEQIEAEKDQPGPQRPRATEPAFTSGNPEVDRLVSYYLDLFGKALESPDWIARAMAVISLARMDDPRITDKLLEVMESNSRRVVQVFAWEALHARTPSLSDAQRERWKAGGLRLYQKGALRGDLRVGLVQLIGADGPTDRNLKTFSRLFGQTNSMDPSDIRTLRAMREVVARWKHARLIKPLIGAMNELDDAYRAELLLGGLGADVPPATSLIAKGPGPMWQETQAAWVAWYRATGAHLTPMAPGSGEPYRGTSVLIPTAEKIADPRDPRWRKDLEIERLHLDQLDVAFVVDSTGSMGQVVRWIKRDVAKLMRAFGMISREPRIGVTFYRDHGDEYVVQSTPLTDDARQLAQAIRNASAKGGADVPEAVYDAIAYAVRKLRWSRAANARKVIILVGDAPPHPETAEQLNTLIAAAVTEGFHFYTVKVSTQWGARDLSSFDRIARTGKGQSVWVDFGTATGAEFDDTPTADDGVRRVSTKKASPAAATRIASAHDTGGPERRIFREVVKAALSEGYRDRVDPFVNVLLEYLEAPVPERRPSFDPPKPSKPEDRDRRRWGDHGGRRGDGGGDAPKPRDPQAR